MCFRLKRLARSQSSSIPSSYSNEAMPNAEQLMLTLSEHQTIRALVLVVFVSNYVVVLFSFDIVTYILISPCIFTAYSLYYLTFAQYLFRKI